MLLVIDTALEKAHVALVQPEGLLSLRENTNSREHAGFVPSAIDEMCRETGIGLAEVAGVVVMNGPGSYTGLRVGLSAAKGICFALEKPLYALSTLELMAAALIRHAGEQGVKIDSNSVFCPMIDARRLEVFTGLYHHSLTTVRKPFALIADEQVLQELVGNSTTLFSGNGVQKLLHLFPRGVITFPELVYEPSDLARITNQLVPKIEAADLAYIEPFYVKDFFNPLKSIS
ncbi:MAG: tRNA (adenosine(37)-N6)-threonylcarbamoyltransferase complex dimerization subunit type 1 TsaB [Bacteroidota bacterium]